MEAPEDIVRRAIDALEAGDWLAVAHLVHPEELARHTEQWRQYARPVPHTVTAQEMRRHEPEMPEAVAAYLADRHNRVALDLDAHLVREFAGVRSPEELEALAADELLARHLEARDPRWQFRVWAERAGRDVPPEIAGEVPPVPDRIVIGAVHEDEDLAHVLYRCRPRGAPPGQGWLEVGSLRRSAEGWRLIPSGDLFGEGSVSYSFGVADTGTEDTGDPA
ncbi:MAG TPA: hypothetical protein VFQ38_21210 [Longimicrobiales bacterium]|nr:hypothetical protein [Longimicrobiales bacterium]